MTEIDKVKPKQRRVSFSQAGLTRAIRAVLAAGAEVSEVVVEPNGSVRIVLGPSVGLSRPNPLDRLLAQPRSSDLSAPSDPTLVSTRDAAKMLACGKTYLFKLIDAGKVEARKQGRATLITVESIRAYQNSLPRKATTRE